MRYEDYAGEKEQQFPANWWRTMNQNAGGSIIFGHSYKFSKMARYRGLKVSCR